MFLDNFEQVIPGALRVADVLTTAPDVAMLVTSREPLLISHEHLYAVPPLPVSSNTGQLAPPDLAASDSVRLFVARAQQARADFQLTPDNAGIIESICQRLDGLPLAIELAAARIAMFTPGALLARMDRSHPLLTGGPRDARHRLRSMHDAIAWSYDLLFPEEQRIFRALAYFAGGWTIEAAEYVCTPDAQGAGAEPQWSIVDRLTSLAAKNLMQAAGDRGPDARFTMLQTVREYGLEQLASSGELEAIGRRHASYFRQLASQVEPALYGRDLAE
ncbi:MAG: ATP-binding protein [Thermomicrobiales bacterium]